MDSSASHRVLSAAPVSSVSQHRQIGGGDGLEVARSMSPDELIGTIERSGLRGRGGAGFPTGTKWQTVLRNRSPSFASTVVVNGAEGEPGTFKDRMLMRRNPYRIVEGALIAAHAVQADTIVFGLKATFDVELERLRTAIEEMRAEGMVGSIDTAVVEGPSEYLFGEETALLEVIDGRQPFPRVAPPFRAGLASAEPATATMAAEGTLSEAPPTLVNNVETLANVPAIVANGAAWFRELGTKESPGTVICTITGRVRHHGVAEVEMGTPLAACIQAIGGGPRPGRTITAAVSGVANAVLPAERHDTPLSYEAMREAGSGLGAAGFVVLDDQTDVAAVVAGMARFLAVESCGQCSPCKADGLEIADCLSELRRSGPEPRLLEQIRDRLSTVTDGARCYLAHQQAEVTASFLPLLIDGEASPDETEPISMPIAPIVDIVNGEAIVDPGQAGKQPDWSYDATDSGAWPAALYGSSEPVPLTESDQPGHDEAAARSSQPPASATAAARDSRPTGALDPVRLLVTDHRRIERLMADASQVPRAERQHVLALIESEVRVHADIAERIVFPMVDRLAGEAGERSVASARDVLAGALRATQDVRSRLEDAGEEEDAAEQLAQLHEEVCDHVREAERSLLTLIRLTMDDAELERLGAAMAEAEATTTETPAEVQ